MNFPELFHFHHIFVSGGGHLSEMTTQKSEKKGGHLSERKTTQKSVI